MANRWNKYGKAMANRRKLPNPGPAKESRLPQIRHKNGDAAPVDSRVSGVFLGACKNSQESGKRVNPQELTPAPTPQSRTNRLYIIYILHTLPLLLPIAATPQQRCSQKAESF